MRKLFLSIFMLVFGLLSLIAQNLALPPEVAGEALYIPFPVAISVDGALDDWAGAQLITVTQGPYTSDNPAENGSLNFAVAADAEYFYIMVTMPDATIITGQHETNFWNEDSIEFYLNLSDERYLSAYTDGIFQFNINPGDIGNTDPSAITLTGVNSANVGLEAFVFATEDGWGFEARVPLGDFVVEHGREIGLQVQANGASELDRNVKLIWSNADTDDQSWNNPALFGSGIFFELGREDIPLPSERPAELVVPEPEPMEARISMNQVGYFPDSPKFAMISADREGLNALWVVYNEAGERVALGMSGPSTLDEASGNFVQIADFSEVTAEGTYTLEFGGILSAPFVIGTDFYAGMSRDALRYFYLNRSGIELEEAYAGAWAREAGHLSDNDLTCYSGTDPQGVTWEACDYRLDVSKGWYDAGDYGKYVVNGGISVWTLLNAYEHHPSAFVDNELNIPESGNGIPDILDEVRWELEFLLGMQVPEGQALAGMVHHKAHDLVWSGVPIMPETMVDNDNPETGRYLMPPSTAATLNLAAVAAQCARVYASIDAEFSQRCLTAAERAWNAAEANPVMIAGNTPGQGGGNYDDANVDDERFWAAAELYITTASSDYLDAMNASPYLDTVYLGNSVPTSLMWWGQTNALGSLSLLTVPTAIDSTILDALKAKVVEAADYYLSVMDSEGYRVSLRGEQFVWGSSSNILNNALVLAYAYEFTGDSRYLNGMTESMDWILGRNAIGISFVSGYGAYSMQHPHHRFWGNDEARGFPPPPNGALSGGVNAAPSDPAADEANLMSLPPARRYVDDIGSYSTNEVAINWNSPLAWVTSYLANRSQ
jgi:endoglucanase